MALFSASLIQIVGGLLVYALLAAILVAVSYVDWCSRRIPNQAIIVLCALRCIVLIVDMLAGDVACALDAFVTGLLVAGGSALLFIALKAAFDAFAHQESLGWGDVKLVFAGFLFLDLAQAVIALFVAAFAGILLAIGFRVICKDRTFPFGPALCLGIAGGLFL